MVFKDDNSEGKTQRQQKRQDRNVESNSRSLGDVSVPSAEVGHYPIAVGRADRKKRDPASTTSRTEDPGGTIGQLIDEAQEQLAYHEEQVEKIKARIRQLSELSDILHQKDPSK